MLITVLTPTRNAARFLPECIASLRAQDWPASRLQHLVLDGLSTDDTVAIARASGAEVSVEEDGSLYEAMNRGLRLARGDVIGWLNADDMLEPGALSAVARRFVADPGLDLVVGDCRYAYPERAIVRRGRAGALRAIRHGARSPQWVVPLAAWFRADVVRSLGGYDSRYRIAADLDLWFRAASREPPLRVAHAGGVLGTFRVHAESLSSARNLAGTRRETLEICTRWIANPAAPPGLRRHALYVHRREELALRIDGEASTSAPRSLAWTLREIPHLSRAGRGTWWDVRELVRASAQRAAVSAAKRILGRAR